MSTPPRLPFPYRPEAEVVHHHLQMLEGALDWSAAAQTAHPWVAAVRQNPPPFWAMESLLREYPISSAEGLALMRLAEALLRVPDAQTAIALTADQLGRADFDSASSEGGGMMARLSASSIALSKKFLPQDGQPNLMSKLGARTVVAATVRAVQLLGRQFVLGQTINEAMNEAIDGRKKMANLRVSTPGRPKSKQPPEGAAQDAQRQAWGLQLMTPGRPKSKQPPEGAAQDAERQAWGLQLMTPGRPKSKQPPEGAPFDTHRVPCPELVEGSGRTDFEAWGLRYSYDMLGEGARTDKDALAYLTSYTNAIQSIAANARVDCAAELNDGISIKLSALHPRYEDAQHARVMAELVPRVWTLCELAARANINLTIDAEEVDRLELSLDVFEALAAQVAQHHPQWRGFGLAMQAYQTRALELIEHVIALARKYELRFMCRLVKGAYWDSEIKRAQEMGLPHYPVFTHKHHTDVAYLACARALLAAPDAIYPQFAGHNAGTIAAIIQMATAQRGEPAPPSPSGRGSKPDSSLRSSAKSSPFKPGPRDWLCQTAGAAAPSGGRELREANERGGDISGEGGGEGSPNSTGTQFELQRLHGMGEGIFREVLKNPAIACRIYAPVGAHRDLLAYLVRRLLENGANSSFVHQLADESIGMDALLTSPLRFDASEPFPLPPALYGPTRPNSLGLDLTVESMRAPLFDAYPSVSVPNVPLFDVKTADSAINTCVSSYQKYSKLPVAERAAMLCRAADSLQQQLPKFCALLVKEAFKTWGDAVSEVREAIDFLRYYANEAERIMRPIGLPQVASGHDWGLFYKTPVLPELGEGSSHPGFRWGVTGETNELRLTARGVWVCISPWNFPLAIFVGQVAAALATGNAVIAKPAEQTPGVALEAVKLLIAAGIPEGVLQLAHGPGETVGAALVAAPGVAGVVFTGSTQVARLINRALAAKDGPITPLIAETGGINAMIVDSSALPEQVTDAVIQSAFRSAGQRCSALRLLCVHEGIADAVIGMIEGAVRELKVGDPAELATDVGPLIDHAAFGHIDQHVKRLNSSQKVLLAQAIREPAATESIAGNILNLLQPAAFEVRDLAEVKDEIFGPVLQIVRWGSGALATPEAVIAQINALGYGLTLGIQTRIDSRAQALAAAAHIGNVYVNRNMIGAVVGVQPFGGEGLSGTGPKAGGPHYLYRFCAEQTVTVNTTAAGGNAALLAG